MTKNPIFIDPMPRSKKPTSLSLLTPEDLRDDNDNFDLNTNLLDLYPDPVHFVRFLKEIDRVDISSEIFVKLLGVYRDQKGNDDTNPVRSDMISPGQIQHTKYSPVQHASLPTNHYADADTTVRRQFLLKHTM